MLRKDESACASDKKELKLCDDCERNLDMQEANGHFLWGEFEPEEVKNFKTGIHFRCDGFFTKKELER